MRRRFLTGAVVVALLAGGALPLACGARSSLDVGEQEHGVDGGIDAAQDVAVDVVEDAPVDAPEDAPPDGPVECSSPEETYIYVVTAENRLWSFRPTTSMFVLVGDLNCPAAGFSPFSMAVDRAGTAHVVFSNGRLYRVSTETALCEETDFEVGQQGFTLFGMGYAPNADDEGETLYVAEISFDQPSLGLASIDTDTYELSYVGPFSQNPGNAIELTPTGSGPLYGYFLNSAGPGGTLVRIDPATAEILEATQLSVGPNSSALALGWWGGRFYIFVTGGNGSEVYRYDPNTMQVQIVSALGETIVGAGVSTCAPGALEVDGGS